MALALRGHSFLWALLVSVHRLRHLLTQVPLQGSAGHTHRQGALPGAARGGKELSLMTYPRIPLDGHSREPCPGQRDLEAPLITGLSVDRKLRPGSTRGWDPRSHKNINWSLTLKCLRPGQDPHNSAWGPCHVGTVWMEPLRGQQQRGVCRLWWGGGGAQGTPGGW